MQYTHTPKRAMSVDERHSQRTDKFHDSRQFEVKSTEKVSTLMAVQPLGREMICTHATKAALVVFLVAHSGNKYSDR